MITKPLQNRRKNRDASVISRTYEHAMYESWACASSIICTYQSRTSPEDNRLPDLAEAHRHRARQTHRTLALGLDHGTHPDPDPGLDHDRGPNHHQVRCSPNWPRRCLSRQPRQVRTHKISQLIQKSELLKKATTLANTPVTHSYGVGSHTDRITSSPISN